MKSEEIVLLHAYLSTDERKEICHKFIKQIKSFGYDVIVASHLPLDVDTQKLTDYAIYDKDNILLSDPALRGYITHYTPKFNISSREFFKHSSILAVLRLLLAGSAYAKLLDKKIIHLFDYDGFLPDDNELVENSDIIKSGQQAVLYEREKENLCIPDGHGKGGTTVRHWQIMTLIMSCNVEFLYKRLTLFSDEHIRKKIMESMQIGEELLGYILGISFHNDFNNTKEDNITIKNLEESTKRIGFEKQKIYTDVDFPWICLAYLQDLKVYRFFAMPPKGLIKVDIHVNDLLYTNFSLADWGYRTETFSELNLNNLKIFVNDNLFKEYDFTKPETKQNIIACNIWHDIPEE